MAPHVLARPFIILIVLLAFVILTKASIYCLGPVGLLSFFVFFYLKFTTGARFYWLFGIPLVIALLIIRVRVHEDNFHYRPVNKSLILEDEFATVIRTDKRNENLKLEIEFKVHNRNCRALVSYSNHLSNPELLQGLSLKVCASLYEVEDSPELEKFDYSEYLLHNHILYRGKIRSINFIDTLPKNYIIHLSSACNLFLQKIIGKNISCNETSGLLIAILLGDKSLVSEKINQQFLSTGTAHILAVSGMHIGILYALLKWCFAIPLFHKTIPTKLKSPFILALIWCFAFITGLGPSILRSAVMFSLLEIGLNLKRVTDSINILCSTGFLMLYVNPCMIYDVGFQLSFFAVLSIFLFHPLIKRHFSSSNFFFNYFLEISQVCLAVQLLVTPISLYHFQSFPTYFLFSNIIWMPLSAIIMFLGIALLLFCWSSQLGLWIGTLCHYAMKFGLLIFDLIEKLPFYQLNDLILSPLQTSLLLLSILFIYGWIQCHQKSYLFISLVTTIATTITPLSTKWSQNQNLIILYKSPFQPILDVCFESKIFSFLSLSSTIQKKTYFQSQHPILPITYFVDTSSQNKFIISPNKIFPVSEKLPIMAIDSLNYSIPEYDFLFIKAAVFSQEDLSRVKLDQIIVLPGASFKIKKYYEEISENVDFPIKITDFRTQSINLSK